MRKTILLILGLIVMTFTLVGCKNDPQPTPPPAPVEDNTVTLSFETFGGIAIAPKTKLEKGSVVSLPTPERAGYVFDYWYTTETLEFGTDLRKTVTVNDNMTVYAGWFALDYNITFISGCGLKVDKINALTDEQITLPVLERESYDFIGWFEDDLQYTRTSMEPRDITLTAKWERKSHQITLNADGGALDNQYLSQTVGHCDLAKLPTPTKSQKVFLGWFEGETQITSETEITKDYTLVAKWDDASKYTSNYTITYALNGGTLSNKVNNYKVGTAITLGTPTKNGYTFLGWYKNTEFLGSPITNITSSDYGNITLYAKWLSNDATYTVKYYDYNGDLMKTIDVKYGEKAENVTIESDDYLEFSWYSNNRLYDFDKTVTSDLNLYAKWSILENVLEDLIPDRTLDNITLPKEIVSSMGSIYISWATSNPDILTINGLTNPLREDTNVELTATFTYDRDSFKHQTSILIEGVTLRDLSNIQPVFAYLSSNMGSYDGMEGVAAETIDVINYCFARVTDSGTVSLGELTKISTVLQARKQGIRVLYSIGAYFTNGGCINISKAASTPESRKKFIDSIITIIEKNHFDGVDIDWEYPGSAPASGITSEQDKTNYTMFMTELRAALDALNPDYLLTAALPGGYNNYRMYDLPALAPVLDYLHLMSYDLHGSGTTHHTALYDSRYTPNGGAASAVVIYARAGFPKEKIVVGSAFYGRIWTLSTTASGIIGSSKVVERSSDYVTYTTIKNSYLPKDSVKTYWDDTAKAPYLFDSETMEFISYDNPRSLSNKCAYVKEEGLGGIMFWDYGEDLTGTLIIAINKTMKPQ